MSTHPAVAPPAPMEIPAQDPTARTPRESKEDTPFLCRRPVRIMLYGFLGLFVVAMLAARFVPYWLDPDFSKHIESHRVMVGMSREQVLESWGSPNTINVSHTKDGLRREEWIFEDWESPAVVKHRYLYFEEGTLIGGHYSGSDQRDPKLTTPESPKRSPHRPPT
ncbi:MAG TPA: hypothetical protein VHF07_07910 [Nitrospiraceae bacterium]|nr:hypothetical protein [Nitrospiraceae bacterium]